MKRRVFLANSGITAFLLDSFGFSHANTTSASINDPVNQPQTPNDGAFISRAFEMRRLAIEYGDQAYGAVIVRENIIIGQSWSRVLIDKDPTGHAEISAIRDATCRINSQSLDGAIMYSSSRPCPMCEAAAYWAGIQQMIYGREIDSAGSPQLCR